MLTIRQRLSAALRSILQRRLWFRIFDLKRMSPSPSEIALIGRDIFGSRLIYYPWDTHSVREYTHQENDEAYYRAMARFVQPGDTVLDVGAHRGFYSLAASRLVGAAGHVWAFEPVPETYWQLREMLVLNRCDNVSAHCVAVSDYAGTASMTVYDPSYSAWNTLGTPEMHTPTGAVVPSQGMLDVTVDTLDAFTTQHNIPFIHFLKVDVEGFETQVFAGAHTLLSEGRIGTICFEISQAPLKGAASSARAVFAKLQSYGYQSYEFQADTGTFHGPVPDSTAFLANYFASQQDLSLLAGWNAPA